MMMMMMMMMIRLMRSKAAVWTVDDVARLIDF